MAVCLPPPGIALRGKKQGAGFHGVGVRNKGKLSRKYARNVRGRAKRLIVFSGPCGSGKSTLARIEHCKRRHTVLISRDEVRKIHPTYDDSHLTKTMIQLAGRVLDAGRSCIIDACNLHEHDRIRWETVALLYAASLDWRTVSTDLEICIARDAARQDPVGADRIREQFASSSQ